MARIGILTCSTATQDLGWSSVSEFFILAGCTGWSALAVMGASALLT